MASHALFVGAFVAGQAPIAARLWNASDAMFPADNDQTKSHLLDICETAGFNEVASFRELRSYMCAVTGELISERPDVDSFGPENTPDELGDPRRSDPDFVTPAHHLLVFQEDHNSPWYTSGRLAEALDARDPEKYRWALRQLEQTCAVDD